jgi:hypothetical protein
MVGRLEVYDENGNLITDESAYTVPELQDVLNNIVTTMQTTALSSTIWYNGNEFVFAVDTRIMFDNLVNHIIYTETSSDVYPLQDTQYNDIILTAADVVELASLIGNYTYSVTVQANSLLSQILTIASQPYTPGSPEEQAILDELETFDYETGWPSNDLTPLIPHNY